MDFDYILSCVLTFFLNQGFKEQDFLIWMKACKMKKTIHEVLHEYALNMQWGGGGIQAI